MLARGYQSDGQSTAPGSAQLANVHQTSDLLLVCFNSLLSGFSYTLQEYDLNPFVENRQTATSAERLDFWINHTTVMPQTQLLGPLRNHLLLVVSCGRNKDQMAGPGFTRSPAAMLDFRLPIDGKTCSPNVLSWRQEGTASVLAFLINTR